nr:uncharacterized protein LOC104113968 [Nicotiana tomentosiformis]
MDDLLMEERILMQNLEKWDLLEEGALKQKERTKWIKLGDSNSKYFTAVIKERQHKNKIVELTSLIGDKITDPTGIKEEIVNFYKGLMGTPAQRLPAIDKSIMAKGDNKAPSVDGFNVDFFKKTWSIIKNEVTEVVTEFFATGSIYKAINSSRLQAVISTVISNSQAGFIPGRKLADNVILAHELVKAYSRKHASPRCMIKIDLQKLMILLSGLI